MNNNPNNINEQTNNGQANVPAVNSNPNVVNNDQPMITSVISQAETPNVSTDVQPVVGSTPQVQSTTPAMPAQSTGQAAETTATQATAQVLSTNVAEVKSAPIAPQQDRVQLINDKPKLHAVIGNNGVVPVENSSTGVVKTESNVGNNTSTETETKQKGSGIRTFFLFVLFGGLFVMIVFLPDISNYIETQKYLRNNPVEEKITTGVLKCSIENSTETLDYKQDLEFSFTDNELTKLTYITKTRGNVGLDDSELDMLKKECDQLVLYSENLNGIKVSCELLDGILTRKQSFDYSSIVVEEAMTAYIEAGGVYPDYENMQNIDNIEKEMNASGYECERIK